MESEDDIKSSLKFGPDFDSFIVSAYKAMQKQQAEEEQESILKKLADIQSEISNPARVVENFAENMITLESVVKRLNEIKKQIDPEVTKQRDAKRNPGRPGSFFLSLKKIMAEYRKTEYMLHLKEWDIDTDQVIRNLLGTEAVIVKKYMLDIEHRKKFNIETPVPKIKTLEELKLEAESNSPDQSKGTENTEDDTGNEWQKSIEGSLQEACNWYLQMDKDVKCRKNKLESDKLLNRNDPIVQKFPAEIAVLEAKLSEVEKLIRNFSMSELGYDLVEKEQKPKSGPSLSGGS